MLHSFRQTVCQLTDALKTIENLEFITRCRLPLAFKLGLVESRVALGALAPRHQTVGADFWVSEVLLLFDISIH